MARNQNTDQWQASTARHQFSRVVDAAVAGRPQFVVRRDGREVVVVSKEYYERTKPDLKSVLLNFKFSHQDDGSFDAALAEGRRLVGKVFTPTLQFERQLQREPDHVGHEHRQRASRIQKSKA